VFHYSIRKNDNHLNIGVFYGPQLVAEIVSEYAAETGTASIVVFDGNGASMTDWVDIVEAEYAG
jgi:hypothetical protein